MTDPGAHWGEAAVGFGFGIIVLLLSLDRILDPWWFWDPDAALSLLAAIFVMGRANRGATYLMGLAWAIGLAGLVLLALGSH